MDIKFFIQIHLCFFTVCFIEFPLGKMHFYAFGALLPVYHRGGGKGNGAGFARCEQSIIGVADEGGNGGGRNTPIKVFRGICGQELQGDFNRTATACKGIFTLGKIKTLYRRNRL